MLQPEILSPMERHPDSRDLNSQTLHVSRSGQPEVVFSSVEPLLARIPDEPPPIPRMNLTQVFSAVRTSMKFYVSAFNRCFLITGSQSQK